jgi:hypothetical protein
MPAIVACSIMAVLRQCAYTKKHGERAAKRCDEPAQLHACLLKDGYFSHHRLRVPIVSWAAIEFSRRHANGIVIRLHSRIVGCRLFFLIFVVELNRDVLRSDLQLPEIGY